jgi:L-rhamnose mutarotase
VTGEKYAFKMKLRPGMEAEYKKRHDEIFPELPALLKGSGISDYSIHLDKETNTLFGVLWRREDHTMGDLPHHPVMKRWWAHMAISWRPRLTTSPWPCRSSPSSI